MTPSETRTHSLDVDSNADDEFVVFVALSNPETEGQLIELGSAIANQRDGHVIAVTIVQVPDQTALAVGREEFDSEASEELLADARRDASDIGVPVETRTIFSHRRFEEIFDAADRYGADVCLMGWGPNSPGVAGRAESVIDELALSLPCDVLVFRDRGFDPSRILLPTTGGPHTDMAAIVARILKAEFGSEVTLLHVADDVDEGREFLETWAAEHDLDDARLEIETGDVEEAIEGAADDHAMILVGATEAGVLSRLARRSLIFDVLYEADCSVLITERETKRSLFERLFRRR